MEITATPTQRKICDGTGPQFLCFGVIHLCTKFHAFTTKCTIPSIINSYPLDYQEPLTLEIGQMVNELLLFLVFSKTDLKSYRHNIKSMGLLYLLSS